MKTEGKCEFLLLCWGSTGVDSCDEEWTEDERRGREKFDDDMQRRAGGILQRIADGVASDSGLVRLRALAAEVAEFYIPKSESVSKRAQMECQIALFGIVPCATHVVEGEREHDARNSRKDQVSGKCLRACARFS